MHDYRIYASGCENLEGAHCPGFVTGHVLGLRAGHYIMADLRADDRRHSDNCGELGHVDAGVFAALFQTDV